MALCGAPGDNRVCGVLSDNLDRNHESSGCFCVDGIDDRDECTRRDDRRIRGCGSLQS